MAWALGKRTDNGRWYLVDGDGGRFEFDERDIPFLAVALAQECEDDEMRGFVASEWAP